MGLLNIIVLQQQQQQIPNQAVTVIIYIVGMIVAVAQLYVTFRLTKLKETIKSEVKDDMVTMKNEIEDAIEKSERRTKDYLDINVRMLQNQIESNGQRRNRGNT